MAITGTKLFASGDVLTANDTNQYLMRGVKVFSSTAVRDAAYGGAGEPTLEEGETCYITATDELQSYDGASWVKIGPAAAPGLRIVKNRTTFSTASTITADSVFTADFDNYKIMLTFTSASTVGNATLQLRAGGVTATTSYNRQELYAISTSVVGTRTTNQTSFVVGTYDDAETAVSDINIWNPQATTETVFQVFIPFQGTATTPEMYFHFGNHATSTAYDGFIITASSGTMTGFYTVYGWNQ